MEQQTQWLPPSARGTAAGPGRAPALHDQRKPLRQRIFGPLLVAGALLLKFGKVGLLLLTKAKFLTTSASMLVSVAAYALIWGWRFAAGFVALLFIHEMGHYIQLRREGVKPSGMVFIPFLGAAVGARSLGGSALAEARVGLAGPILGSLACLIPAGLWIATGNEFWQALAFTGFFLNLFNLVPVVPFDGGRAMAAMAPWMWFVGLGAMARAADRRAEPVRRSSSCCSAPSRPTSAGRPASRARRATPPTTASSRRTGSWSARSTWG